MKYCFRLDKLIAYGKITYPGITLELIPVMMVKPKHALPCFISGRVGCELWPTYIPWLYLGLEQPHYGDISLTQPYSQKQWTSWEELEKEFETDGCAVEWSAGAGNKIEKCRENIGQKRKARQELE